MKRSIILPMIFSLGLLCSAQKSEAIDINSKYKIALVGVGIVAALIYFTSEEDKRDSQPLLKTFLCSALFSGLPK